MPKARENPERLFFIGLAAAAINAWLLLSSGSDLPLVFFITLWIVLIASMRLDLSGNPKAGMFVGFAIVDITFDLLGFDVWWAEIFPSRLKVWGHRLIPKSPVQLNVFCNRSGRCKPRPKFKIISAM